MQGAAVAQARGSGQGWVQGLRGHQESTSLHSAFLSDSSIGDSLPPGWSLDLDAKALQPRQEEHVSLFQ